MSVRSVLAISLLTLAACGGDDGNDMPDGAPKDSSSPTVMEVTCPATPAATFRTLASTFDPTTATISRGGIVKFETTTDHPVIPARDGVMTDTGIMVGENRTKCLTFTATGTFRFVCGVHNYLGVITVN